MKSSGAYAAFKACKGLFGCRITEVLKKPSSHKQHCPKEVMCDVPVHHTDAVPIGPVTWILWSEI